MQAGVAQSHASYVLFTDADIWHPPDSLQKTRLTRGGSKNSISPRAWSNCIAKARWKNC